MAVRVSFNAEALSTVNEAGPAVKASEEVAEGVAPSERVADALVQEIVPATLQTGLSIIE